jgi:TolB-like protein
MMTGARFAAAGVCFGAGIFAAWAIQHQVRVMRATAPVVWTAARGGSVTGGSVTQESPSILWVVAVGVSRYRDPALNLRFADSDADAIAAAFGKQRGGPLYRDVRTQVLLNEQVTREAILTALEGLLGQVHVDDVVLLFLAGHGVQDTTLGSYYFLPWPATAETMRTHGLRMTDVDEMLRVLRSNVRGVMIILDTCHAGALRSSRSVAGNELVTPMPAGDGFFLFAASRPGEESKEDADLGHGTFTYALLEGLAGAADADGDGVLPVSELFGYVARRVPVLTDGEQHPYYKIEGTDLMLAALSPGPVATTPRLANGPAPSSLAVNTIGVTEFHNLRGTPEDDWIGKAIRVAFNTELSKVRSLRVYVPQVIDRTSGARRADYLAAAHQLGIRRLVTGSYHVVGPTLRIDAEIVDTAAGVQEASDSVQGDLGDFFTLQKQLVRSMLSRLRVQASSEEELRIQKEGSTDIDAYRLLLETEGVVDDRTPPRATAPTAVPQPTPERHSRLGLLHRLLAQLRSSAQAAEPPPEVTTAVRQTIEAFRQALEHKDLARLASLYVAFSEKHRAVLEAYLRNADELTVEFTDITLEIRPAGVLVTYTRVDRFVDHESHQPVRLEARLARLIVRESQTWKLGDAQ